MPSSAFLDKKRKNDIAVVPLNLKTAEGWLKGQSATIRAAAKQRDFRGQPGKIFLIAGKAGELDSVAVGLSNPVSLYDLAGLVGALRQNYSAEFIKGTSFTLQSEDLKKSEITALHLGWALACYNFDTYKKSAAPWPGLVWDKKADKRRVETYAESITLLRDMVNTPSNDMGPAEIENSARQLAKQHKAKFNVIHDKALVTKKFPLVYAVGDSSPRRPRLIDVTWGNPKNPKVTIVGKGVCFDTGGLNLKPSSYMALMKKDMGGAAHALALANMVMSLKLPVALRVLIPAVENSVSGHSFRPGDIFTSRKGLTVENTNTDAEGRLILADALTYACEEKPDLLIDFATLTGSARAALGPDIPAAFSNNDKIAEQLKKIAFASEDPVWPMPLWQPYQKHNDSASADMHNSSGVPGDLIYSALFLERFVTPKTNWIHIDTYAWEHTGRPGRPRGGADCGLRAVFALLEERY